MKIKIVIEVLSFFILFVACKQSSATKTSTDENVKKEANFILPSHLKFEKSEEIDIDNDLQKEIIITASDSLATKQYEFWLKNNKLIHKFTYPWVSINYKWLLNLDEDPENEIIRAQGYEDGVDYVIFDIKDENQVPLLYFNPALKDDKHPEKIFWGYPGDMNNLIINNKMEILSSVDNIQNRDDNHFVPSTQKQLPYLLFQGTTKQPEFRINNLNNFQYAPLSQIQESSKKTIKIANKLSQNEILNFDITGQWKSICENKKSSYLLLKSKQKKEGTIEIYNQFGNLVAKMMIEYSTDNQSIKYIGTSIIGDSVDSQNISSLSTGDIIAKIKFIDENKISVNWLGLYNKTTQKRMFLENPFGDENPKTIEKCSN